MKLFGDTKKHILKYDYTFESERFSGENYNGAWLVLHNNKCTIRQGAVDDGATFARDENAVISWSFHDNAYEDKYCPLTRLQIDLIMYDLLKKEGFRWFRYKWIKKINKDYNGINTIWIYFVMVRIFGWIKYR